MPGDLARMLAAELRQRWHAFGAGRGRPGPAGRPGTGFRAGPGSRPAAPAAARRRARVRTARLAAAWTGGMVSATILTVSGYGWSVTDAVQTATTHTDVFGALDADGRPVDAPGTDILLVGSDTRAGLSQNAEARLHTGGIASADGARSDTIILAHLTADQKSLTLMSIPRDSYADIPAWKSRPEHHDKINSALNLGGPALTVATVEHDTGIRIDHFVQVDFSAFAGIVDSLDGVDVCLPKAAHDPLSGLDLPAGVSHVDGVQALAYVRARYTLTGGSDLGRIHRQQQFLGSLAARAEASGLVTDPGRLAGLVRALAASVATDPGLDTEGLLKLALAVKGIPRDRIQFVSVPLADVNHQVPEIGSTVLWDPVYAPKLFQALRADQPVAPVLAAAQDADRQAAAAAEQARAAADAPASATPEPDGPDTAGPGAPGAPAPATPDHPRTRSQGPQPSAVAARVATQDICR